MTVHCLPLLFKESIGRRDDVRMLLRRLDRQLSVAVADPPSCHDQGNSPASLGA